jgi:hypothetical protein
MMQGHLRKTPGPDTSGSTYTLPGVLHFLQQEWRRFERDRNEWEMERAELKVNNIHHTIESMMYNIYIRHVF